MAITNNPSQPNKVSDHYPSLCLFLFSVSTLHTPNAHTSSCIGKKKKYCP